MNQRLFGALKISLLAIGTLVVVLLIGVTVAINFIFTSEKLTPMVLKVANSSMNAKLNMERVELTFFSTFPRLGLQLTQGSLVSKAERDTLWEKTDSLVAFKKCVVVVNPFDYLCDKKINLRYLGLEDASVYAYKGKNGVANWDIALPDTVAVADTMEQTEIAPISEIEINRVSLKRANVTFDDRDTRVYANLKNANLTLKASLKKDHLMMETEFSNENILFWQNGQLLINKVATELKTTLDLNHSAGILALHDTRLTVNGIALDVDGTLKRDSQKQAADVNLTYSLHAPSLKTVLYMIPESIVKKEEVNAEGEVLVNGALKGWYGKGQMPVATLNVKIKEAAAKYAKLPYGVDKFEADFYSYIDLMKKTPSYADLKIFHFQGAHTDVLAEAEIQDLLGDPDIKFKTKSVIDLTALAQTFPLQEGVEIKGKVNADLNLHCRLSSLKRQDFGRVRLAGNLSMSDLSLRDKLKDFEFTSDASLDFMGDESLVANAEIKQVALRSPKLTSDIERLKATLKSSNPQDTTRVVSLECKLELNRLKGKLNDSLSVFTRKMNATVSIDPSKQNPVMPQIKLAMETDTLFCRMGQTRIGMDKGGFGLRAEKVNDSLWLPKGIIGFRHLVLRVPEFALPIHMEKTSVTVGDRKITLRNALMKVGHSDITATGVIHDLYGVMKKKKTLKATLELYSHKLDCNQLVNSLNFPEDTLQVEADTISNSAPMELFVIPHNVDAELRTKLEKVTYGKMTFENVCGDVDVRNQAVHLKKLTMRGLDADMQATVVYRARQKSRGYAGFDFRLKGINVGKLVDFAPALDTIVPMLRSFKGIVNFEAAAEAVLDSNLNIKIPTLRSAMHIKGDSLVLMDGETFAEISKMLLFKNKKRNVFDSIAVNLIVENGNVTVYPFLVQIDRYKAAVGGTQGLDMNFNYHISILKSPIPFKLGLNISGNLDKMKFRLGKAKYKDDVTPVAIHRVDSTRINMGRNIVDDFEKVMKRGGQIPQTAE